MKGANQSETTESLQQYETHRSIVVFSSGRSGSNRLLDIFDQHEWTNCRNELGADDPKFLLQLKAIANEPEAYNRAILWEEAISRVALRKGRRDRYELSHKAYLRPGLRLLWQEVYRRGRVRRILVQNGEKEWPINSAVIARGAAPRIIPVIKLNLIREGLLEAFASTSSLLLVHKIRSPSGYLTSWYNRYVVSSGREHEEIYTQLLRKARILSEKYGLAPPSESYSLHGLFRAELLAWRQQNERMFAACHGSPLYTVATYSRVSQAPVAEARRLYSHAGLNFTSLHAERIRNLRNTLFAKPHSVAIDPSLLDDVVAEVAREGPLAELFEAAKSSSGAGTPPT